MGISQKLKRVIHAASLLALSVSLIAPFSDNAWAAKKSKKQVVSRSRSQAKKVSGRVAARSVPAKRHKAVASKIKAGSNKKITKGFVKSSGKSASRLTKTQIGQAKRGLASSEQSVSKSSKYAAFSPSRQPDGLLTGSKEVDKPLKVQGQTRNLSMMLVLKGEKDKIKFGEIRENYKEEIPRTAF